MSDERTVLMSAEQAAEIDRHLESLMRSYKNERASLMMQLALNYKFAKSSEPVLPDNVIDLAERIEAYSRKAPCA